MPLLREQPTTINESSMTAQTNVRIASDRANEGIKRAEDKANAVHENWSEKAFDFLVGYIKINPVFQVEDVRFASQGVIPMPHSQRSWGAIIRRAVYQGLIWQDGFAKTKSAKSHRTPAAVWKSKIVK